MRLKHRLAPCRHSGESRNLAVAFYREREIPAFAGMTIQMKKSGC
ncbi:hypothetical protein SAMN06295955_12221 [Sphingopyxis indica]|uniref:Uncharacterized protein n=1 Tax=Sphingopyxis indica TaxID=436663 RepID=A0A239LDH7_9SPHN|nr:hypothetical protein SAMN06295955_12221 [Sphingopyxis indica]